MSRLTLLWRAQRLQWRRPRPRHQRATDPFRVPLRPTRRFMVCRQQPWLVHYQRTRRGWRLRMLSRASRRLPYLGLRRICVRRPCMEPAGLACTVCRHRGCHPMHLRRIRRHRRHPRVVLFPCTRWRGRSTTHIRPWRQRWRLLRTEPHQGRSCQCHQVAWASQQRGRRRLLMTTMLPWHLVRAGRTLSVLQSCPNSCM